MTKLSFLIILPYLISSCNSGNYDYYVENKLYQCATERYGKLGISLGQTFENLEAIMIETGSLKNNSAESYFSLFKNYAETGNFPKMNSNQFFNRVSDLNNFPVNLSCKIEQQDSAIYSKSKTNEFAYKLSKHMKDRLKNDSAPNIGKVVLNTYTVEDFNNEYIKFTTLSILIQHKVGLKSLEREIPDKFK